REFGPLHGRFGPFEILTMPPPSSGGAVVLQMLNVLGLQLGETLGARGWTLGDPECAHAFIEAMKHAFADRANFLGDFSDEVMAAVRRRIDPQRARDVLAKVDPARTHPSEFFGLRSIPNDAGTSHFCVVDGDGMAVSATDTVNLTFGSYLHVPGTGIILNNEMDDFAIDPETPNAFGLRESPRNLLQPGRRPLSSMTPVIVLRDDRVALVAGASGGPRIISATLEVILNVIVGGMTVDQAVTAPRLHHQWMPDEVWMSRATEPAVVTGLMNRGHAVRWYPGTGGHAQAIARMGQSWRGACDPDKE